MISAGSPSAMSARRASSARPVLPVAVAPAMTRSGGASRCRGVTPAAASGEGAAQRVRAGVVDPDASTSRPRSVAGPAQVDELVLAASGRERPARRGRAAGRRPVPSSWSWLRGGVDGVDEDLDLAAEPGPVALEPDPLLEREELVQAAALRRPATSSARCVGGRAGPLARRRPRRPGRSGPSRAGASVASNCGLGLAAEPDDDVGRDRDARAPPSRIRASRSR